MLCSPEGSAEEFRDGMKQLGIYGAEYESTGWLRSNENPCATGTLEARGEPTRYTRVHFGRDDGELCVQRIDVSDVQKRCD